MERARVTRTVRAALPQRNDVIQNTSETSFHKIQGETKINTTAILWPL